MSSSLARVHHTGRSLRAWLLLVVLGVVGIAVLPLPAEAAAPASVTVTSGDGQIARPGTAFLEPLVVTVRDAARSPVAGVLVTFTVVRGPASFDDPSQLDRYTDQNGRATSADLIPGDTEGEVVVSATAEGVPTPARFTATVRNPIYHLELSPANATVAAGSARDYEATLVDDYNNTFTVTQDADFTITPVGDGASLVGADCVRNRCSVTAPGRYVVSATVSQFGDTPVGPYTATTPLTATAGPARANLGLSLIGPGSARPKTRFTLTTVVSNGGPAPSDRTLTAVALPCGYTVVDAGGGSLLGSTVVFTSPGLAVGARQTYTLTASAQVNPRCGTTVRAAAISTVRDPDYRNNVAAVPVPIR